MMRFQVNEQVIVARLPADPLRGETMRPHLGRTATVMEKLETLYLISLPAPGAAGFYVSDDMLDPVEEQRKTRDAKDVIIQSLGIAADSHLHDATVWRASKNPALEPAITEAMAMHAECEELRDKLIVLTYPALAKFIEELKLCG